MGSSNGALLVDKPAGPSSHDVVARARKCFGIRAVGHTGTLDPFATGLLVLVMGTATRLARWAARRPKTYRAVARLGQVTTTDDLTGQLVRERQPSSWPETGVMRDALQRLVGTIEQRPPPYSAKQVGGVRSYQVMRRGGEPPSLAPVRVTVHGVELLEWTPPFLTFRAEVGAGTYLRALARDVGESLDLGAHLVELRREQVGRWTVGDSCRLENLSGSEPLLPSEELVGDLLRVDLTVDEARAVGHGRDIQRDAGGEATEAALYEEGRLVAVAERNGSAWHPSVVLHDGQGAIR